MGMMTQIMMKVGTMTNRIGVINMQDNYDTKWDNEDEDGEEDGENEENWNDDEF